MNAYVSNNRATLRDANGHHLQNLNAEEQEAQDWLVERGEVIRTKIIKKGRELTIYTQKAPKEKPIDPSDSANAECSLSEHDSRAIAGLFEEPTRRQIERWMGWGLIAS